MTPSDATDDERNISLTAHQPRHIINGVIRIANPAEPPSVFHKAASSDLGNMEALPLELLHAIFAMLDLKTLSDMTRTCYRATEVVKSLPEYHDLMRHAPLALTALGKTRLIRHHSAATVHAALLSTACVSCHQHGAFLFLPTCQRVCYLCLAKNQSLWLVPVSVARKCFGLSASSAKTLPTMRSLPGKYYVKHCISRQRPIGLVCVGSAKRLALAMDGTEEQMRHDLETEYSAKRLSEKQYYELCHLLRAPLSSPGADSHLHSTAPNVTNDLYCGMASLPFPYLAPDKRAEGGYWCLGCEQVRRKWSPNDPIPEHLAYLLRPGCRADDVVNMMQNIARSRAGHLSHIDQCPGAKALIQSAKEDGTV